MYTRCPECRTPFKITRAQLAARVGLVRCGRCDAVFRAHEQLLEPPVSPAAKAGDGQSPKRRRRKSTHGATHSSRRSNDPGIPTISEFSFAPKTRRLHPAIWGILNLALFLGLAGQLVFFYRNDLARYPAIEPLVGELCHALGCRIEPPAPPPLPELSETTIAPHPRFANALRIRAVMVNRTAAALPYPLMEVNLTDSNGSILARRTFESRQYLENPAGAGARLQSNVAINALIDLINPDGKAVGYEIQLVRPNETGSN